MVGLCSGWDCGGAGGFDAVLLPFLFGGISVDNGSVVLAT